MKRFVLIFVFPSLLLMSCGSSQHKDKESANDDNDSAQAAVELNQTPVSVPDAVVIHYLDLKNDLAADNSNGAAEAGSKLYADLISLKPDSLNNAQKKTLADISADAMENAQNISKSGGNIKDQRKQFEKLSDEIYSFVQAFGTTRTLYKDYCPMAKANWLSESGEIRNPYYGKEMSDCGVIEDTLKVE